MAYYHMTSQLCVHLVVLVRLLLTLTVKAVSLTISASASLTVSPPNKSISLAVSISLCEYLYRGRSNGASDADFSPPWKNASWERLPNFAYRRRGRLVQETKPHAQ